MVSQSWGAFLKTFRVACGVACPRGSQAEPGWLVIDLFYFSDTFLDWACPTCVLGVAGLGCSSAVVGSRT